MSSSVHLHPITPGSLTNCNRKHSTHTTSCTRFRPFDRNFVDIRSCPNIQPTPPAVPGFARSTGTSSTSGRVNICPSVWTDVPGAMMFRNAFLRYIFLVGDRWPENNILGVRSENA
ncbi:hypothetical protein QE152_g6547 [Popillia japonica]|uniref:Uncharacterized protein n=1 Tax=Popillia japonica TaxID=7064 RepID=A0AAW1MGX0_POPJA